MSSIRCNGAELYYEDHGTGPTVVFLHGAWAGLRFFEPQLTGLSTDCRTVALDFRGHGRSEKTEAGHTVRQYARDVRTFLDRLDLDEVVLVGWSMGAGVIWEYVDQFGTERVRAVVDVDAPLSPVYGEDHTIDPEVLTGVSETIEGAQTDHLALIEATVDRLLAEPASRELRTMILDEESRTPPPIKSAIFADTLREPPDVLGDIDVPALVCAGGDETWRTVASVRAVAEQLPDATFEVFEDCGHCITVEAPERFNRVLRRFIRAS